MQASFDSLHASRKRAAAATEMGLSLAIRVAVYLGMAWWGFWRGSAKAVPGVRVEALGPLAVYLSVPYLARGQVSVTALLLMAIVSFAHVLQAMLRR